MSKTPRTDKNAFTIYREASSGELTGAIRVVPYRVSEQLETELAEARAEIERLNKNTRLLLCEKCRAKCEGGLFNSKYPEDEPCLICELKKAERAGK